MNATLFICTMLAYMIGVAYLTLRISRIGE